MYKSYSSVRPVSISSPRFSSERSYSSSAGLSARYAYGAKSDTVWGSILFKLVSIPFAALLIAVLINQTVSVHDYSTRSESSTDTGSLVGNTLF